ncbi:unnamed protein product [Orchesella dallaii]|uniref:glutathione-specific gamma-glutamylcyclotransferase n=1 Tax=Orchesella dallaii TaxID=48710 RepID=A0ABP1SAA7_9HEXA
MWIFGYGSLVWKVDFPYTSKLIGYIEGYERRFWQASIDHRGTPDKPGRVVTLVPSSNSRARVWGVSYKLEDEEAISRLMEREKRYSQVNLTFFPVPLSNPSTDATSSSSKVDTCRWSASVPTSSFTAVTYIGPQNGPLFLGEANLDAIAHQIATASGPSGSNVDYLFKLAQFMRIHLSHVQDEHLFQLEIAAVVWGAAYKIGDNEVDEVVSHLDEREVMGYHKVPIMFHPVWNHPLNETTNGTISEKGFEVSMYYGSEENEHFIGEAGITRMAQDIWECVGPSGSNKDYLFNLCNAMRQIATLLPNDGDDAGHFILDEHLVTLESAVRELDKMEQQQSK